MIPSNKYFLFFTTDEKFKQMLASGDILDKHICFLKESQRIYNRGVYFTPTDSADIDVAYHSSELAPANLPAGHKTQSLGNGWVSTAQSNSNWMAISTCKNGVWSDWLVIKINGRDGKDGKDGKDGRDGTDGQNGKPGEQGPKGDKGEDGTTWDINDEGYWVKDGKVTSFRAVASGPTETYHLPEATADRLGGIKVGDYLNMNDGKLSVNIESLKAFIEGLTPSPDSSQVTSTVWMFKETPSHTSDPVPYGKLPNIAYDSKTDTISGEANDWTRNSITPKLDYSLWMIYGSFDSKGNLVGAWHGPWTIARDGASPGEDNDSLEYAYCLSTDIKKVKIPDTNNSEDIVKFTADRALVTDTWTDNPQGVSELNPTEYCIIRVRPSGAWCSPFIWSSFGKNGLDGDGVEYIFKGFSKVQESGVLNPTPADWETSLEYQSRDKEYIPKDLGWSDDPVSISSETRVCYVCKRRYNGIEQKWEKFSDPAIWTQYVEGRTLETMTISAYYYDKNGDKSADEINVVNGVVSDMMDKIAKGQLGSYALIPNEYVAANYSGWKTKSPTAADNVLGYWVIDFYVQGDKIVNGGALTSKYVGGATEIEVINGVSTITSFMFKRDDNVVTLTEEQKKAGSYSDYNPSLLTNDGWSDGVPSKTSSNLGDVVWYIKRRFSSDGTSDAEWSTPAVVGDSPDLDICFHDGEGRPNPPKKNGPNSAPSTQNDPNGWHQNPDDKCVWMAMSKKSNGIWSDWLVIKIKGEDGENGTHLTFRYFGSYSSAAITNSSSDNPGLTLSSANWRSDKEAKYGNYTSKLTPVVVQEGGWLYCFETYAYQNDSGELLKMFDNDGNIVADGTGTCYWSTAGFRSGYAKNGGTGGKGLTGVPGIDYLVLYSRSADPDSITKTTSISYTGSSISLTDELMKLAIEEYLNGDTSDLLEVEVLKSNKSQFKFFLCSSANPSEDTAVRKFKLYSDNSLNTLGTSDLDVEEYVENNPYLWLVTAKVAHTRNPEWTENSDQPEFLSEISNISWFRGTPLDADMSLSRNSMVAYNAGIWNNTKQYEITFPTDEEPLGKVPYVAAADDNGKYCFYLLNSVDGKSVVGSSPVTDTSRWLKMAENEATFTKLALIGRGLIGKFNFYGDYLFSTDGQSIKQSDSDTNVYTFEDFLGNESKFKPNFYVNANTGDVHLSGNTTIDGNVTIGGNVDANITIKNSNTYGKYLVVTDDNFDNINTGSYRSDKTNLIDYEIVDLRQLTYAKASTTTGLANLYLPNAGDYVGKYIKIVSGQCGLSISVPYLVNYKSGTWRESDIITVRNSILELLATSDGWVILSRKYINMDAFRNIPLSYIDNFTIVASDNDFEARVLSESELHDGNYGMELVALQNSEDKFNYVRDTASKPKAGSTYTASVLVKNLSNLLLNSSGSESENSYQGHYYLELLYGNGSSSDTSLGKSQFELTDENTWLRISITKQIPNGISANYLFFRIGILRNGKLLISEIQIEESAAATEFSNDRSKNLALQYTVMGKDDERLYGSYNKGIMSSSVFSPSATELNYKSVWDNNKFTITVRDFPITSLNFVNVFAIANDETIKSKVNATISQRYYNRITNNTLDVNTAEFKRAKYTKEGRTELTITVEDTRGNVIKNLFSKFKEKLDMTNTISDIGLFDGLAMSKNDYINIKLFSIENNESVHSLITLAKKNNMPFDPTEPDYIYD